MYFVYHPSSCRIAIKRSLQKLAGFWGGLSQNQPSDGGIVSFPVGVRTVCSKIADICSSGIADGVHVGRSGEGGAEGRREYEKWGSWRLATVAVGWIGCRRDRRWTTRWIRSDDQRWPRARNMRRGTGLSNECTRNPAGPEIIVKIRMYNASSGRCSWARSSGKVSRKRRCTSYRRRRGGVRGPAPWGQRSGCGWVNDHRGVGTLRKACWCTSLLSSAT